MKHSPRLGLVGIGGYGQQHLSVLNTLQGYGLCRLVAVADPCAAQHGDAARALESDGVEIYTELAPLLEHADIEAVVLATPIHWHAPQAILALQAGKNVYMEKPPCATLGEWQQLVAAQQAASRVCAVGFQMQTSPALHFLKRQLAQGALGKLQRVWTAVRWQRTTAYYERSAWAGRWSVDGRPVFDGPATNALAHVVHAALFLAGATESDWATLTRVRGALRKARPIESYDSAYLEAETNDAVKIQLAFTHATSYQDEVVIHCAGDTGEAQLQWNGKVTITAHGEPPQSLFFAHQPAVAAMLDFLRAISGDEPSGGEPQAKPATALADTLAYLQMTNGACQSSRGAHAFPKDKIECLAEGTPASFYQVEGLDTEMDDFRANPSTAPPSLQLTPMPWLEPSQLAPDLPS